jgi:hypothetical protein
MAQPRQRSVRSTAERIADLGLEAAPSIVDYVFDGLMLTRLFPRQATILKLIHLEDLTDYDRRVVHAWGSGFRRGVDAKGLPCFDDKLGIVPDVLDRTAECRSQGRRWFAEVVLAWGRRGGKSLIAAICAARMIDELLRLGDPQDHFGIVAGKRLTIGVFAGQEEQARALLFRDVVQLMTRTPRYKPFVAGSIANRLTFYSPRQVLEHAERRPEDAVIELVAYQATADAARGPASPMLLFDEMAFMVNQGANRAAEEIVAAATPAMAQFREWSQLIETSSPGPQYGQFYDNAQYALRLNDAGEPLAPRTLTAASLHGSPTSTSSSPRPLDSRPARTDLPFRRSMSQSSRATIPTSRAATHKTRAVPQPNSVPNGPPSTTRSSTPTTSNGSSSRPPMGPSSPKPSLPSTCATSCTSTPPAPWPTSPPSSPTPKNGTNRRDSST